MYKHFLFIEKLTIKLLFVKSKDFRYRHQIQLVCDI